ncbi:calcium-transporting ATPase 1, endoplasmic reticulum-type-like [Herrania umbratica]|uniref:P-type Ca(2+) transporter n=1 Tax=Herrania umbratica TaxID=108875 RepID=A0A6J1ATA6_9ROSI|nr:calcium-transporting ATPase 1, endoplasmic reticulum-type-like [Herrania umbratica]
MGKGGEDYGKREMITSRPTAHPVVFPAWAKDIQECEKHYQVNKKWGLSSAEVENRRKIYGYNELEKHEGQSLWSLILEQFNDTLVRILLVAAVVSFVLAWYDGEEGGEMEITAFVEPLVIFLILIVNAVVGVWQENNAEKALEALKEIQSEQATVIRDGVKIPNLPAKELVPGDIIELKVGDKVPADMRVLELVSSTLRVEQGSLTGESEAVNKTSKLVSEDADIQGKRSMVFAGTTVVNGNCFCLVTQIGMETEIGKVHTQIHVAAQSEEDTPLKKKLNEFGEVLTMIIGVVCVFVWLINVKYFLSWEFVDGWPRNFKFSFEKCTYYFEIAVALAVAAIPEGLPAVITTCLALGTRKMAQKNALVRKLPSVETLGCTTVICSDKTGTLTTNQMAVAKLVAMGGDAGRLRSFTVDGTTYNPSDGKIHDWPSGGMDANLQTIAKIAAICNDAGVTHSDNKFVAHGMPTEAAIKVLVENMGLPKGSHSSGSAGSNVLRCCQWWNEYEHRIATLEFDRDRKSMGVIVNSKSGRRSLLVKGAVENLLERSSKMQLCDGSVVPLDQNSRNLVSCALQDMSSGQLRCLGFAYKDELPKFETYDGSDDHPAHDHLLNPSNYSSIESNLTFVGLVGLRDPPRAEVHQAIVDCKAAGIRVMVITGDNKDTAEAICREIGVFRPTEDISSKSLTGKEFMELLDKKAHLRQSGGLLFSRAEPRHKQEISCGKSYLSGIELFIILYCFAQVIGLYVGMATVGIFIIWYTHGSFLGIDLSGDGHTLVTYSQLANWGQCSSWKNFTVSPFTAGTQVFSFENNPCDYFQGGKVKAMTLSLSVLVAIEMFNSLNALSEDGSLLTMPPWVNPWLLLAMSVSFGLHFLILYVPFLAQVFGIVPLSFNEWLLVLSVAFPVILIDEILKFIGRSTSGIQSSRQRPLKPKSE